MKNIALMVATCGLVLMASGCATTSHISELPRSEEFSRSLADLKAEYPDLTKYSSAGRDWFVTVYDMPEAEPLQEAWNEPHHTRLSAWMLFPVIPWILHPTTVWTWDYNDKEISARIDHPIVFGYRPHVWKLNVEEKR